MTKTTAPMTRWNGLKPGGAPVRRTSSGDKLGAAVDVQRLAGDVRRLVAAEEGRGGRDVLRVAAAAYRVGLGGHLAQLLGLHLEPARGVVGHVGGDEAGRDRVGVDAEGAELDAEG